MPVGWPCLQHEFSIFFLSAYPLQRQKRSLEFEISEDRFDEGGHRPLKNVLATKVAEKIAQEKREKMQLQQDLESIKDQFIEIE